MTTRSRIQGATARPITNEQHRIPQMAGANAFDVRSINSADAQAQVEAGTNDYQVLGSLAGETRWMEHPGIIPVGGEIVYYGAEEPAGGNWKFPNGQAISRTEYPACFALMGTTHGAGDGTTTFNLPTGNGRVRVQLDDGEGVLTGTDTVGSTEGAQTVTLAEANLPSHTHTISVTDPGHAHGGFTQNSIANFTLDPETESGTTGISATTNNQTPVITITDPGHSHGGVTGARNAFTSGITVSSATTSITVATTKPNVTVTDPGHTHTAGTLAGTGEQINSNTAGTGSSAQRSSSSAGANSQPVSISGSTGSNTTGITAVLATTPTSTVTDPGHAHVTSAATLNTAGDLAHTHNISSGTTGISAANASHSHTVSITDGGHVHDISASALNAAQTAHTHVIPSGTTGVTASASSVGSGTAHQNMQPSIRVNALIRVR